MLLRVRISLMPIYRLPKTISFEPDDYIDYWFTEVYIICVNSTATEVTKAKDREVSDLVN